MASPPAILRLKWRDLFRPIRPVPSDRRVVVEVEREVIPIVFVPGIMGSRLKRLYEGPLGEPVGLAWEPEIETDWKGIPAYLYRKGLRESRQAVNVATGFFNATAESRKSQIIGRVFDPAYLGVVGRNEEGGPDPADRDVATMAEAIPNAFERGWAGVSMTSYGDLLRYLDGYDWPEPIAQCFELPVHAYGYNWTQSNLKSGHDLVEHIDRLITEYRDRDRECHRVILVTHSMGGLVARAACKALQGRGSTAVLGVLHGVQPTSGAAAAYWRMKGGFEERGISLLVGKNAEETTALLGNMPGGLQLLPNARYYAMPGGERTTRWLRYPDPADGARVERPVDGDPYQDIYLERRQFYRLCKEEHLDPGGMMRPPDVRVSPWRIYEALIGIARAYHEAHETFLHPTTVQFYARGLDTSEVIEYDRTPDSWWQWIRRNAVHYGRVGIVPGPLREAEEEDANTRNYRARVFDDGTLVDEDHATLLEGSDAGRKVPITAETYDGDVYLMTLLHAYETGGTGDGTVPYPSGRGIETDDPDRTIELGPDAEPRKGARKHEPVYRYRVAQHITTSAIKNFCLGLIGDAGGAPGDTPGGDGGGSPTGDGGRSNLDTRRWYRSQTDDIPARNEQWKAEGLSAETRARRASGIRHRARLDARDGMSHRGDEEGTRLRDTIKYGNPDGPTFEWLVDQQRERGLEGDAIYEAIIEGSSRTDAATDQRYQ